MFSLRVELETADVVTIIEQRVPDALPQDHEQLTFEVLREIRGMFAVMMPAGAADEDKPEF